MKRLLSSAASALTLIVAGVASAAPQQAQPLTAYDVRQANGWAEQLALCDLTYFLMTRPDVNADRIYVQDHLRGEFRRLEGSLFRPPNLIFDEEVRRGYEALKRAQLIDARSFAAARASYDREMLRSYDRYEQSQPQQAFLDEQGKRCVGIVEAAKQTGRASAAR